MKKIAFIFGTRPDTIKLAPIIHAFGAEKEHFSVTTISTAQHREMLDQVLSVFHISPDYDLNIMRCRQSLAEITGKMIEPISAILQSEKPDMVIVQGDTSTTFVGALAAFYLKIPVCHVEAGLRTHDIMTPFPEELNRRLTSTLATLHLPPTPYAKKHLLREGVKLSSIFVTGNSVIDALQFVVKEDYLFNDPQLNSFLTREGKQVLVTMHRRENLGEPMKVACCAIQKLAIDFPDANFIFPIHLNPQVREIACPQLCGLDNVLLLEPLPYIDFGNLIAKVNFIITDSGGLQEEGPSLGKPVLVLREKTERPEAIKFGTAKLIGLREEAIYSHARRLLSDDSYYLNMARATNPYGDGKAAIRTVNFIKKYFGFKSLWLQEFSPVPYQLKPEVSNSPEVMQVNLE